MSSSPAPPAWEQAQELIAFLQGLDATASLAFLRVVDPTAFALVGQPTRAWSASGLSAWLRSTGLSSAERADALSSCPGATAGGSFLGLARSGSAALHAAIDDATEWDRCWDQAPESWSAGACRVFLGLSGPKGVVSAPAPPGRSQQPRERQLPLSTAGSTEAPPSWFLTLFVAGGYDGSSFAASSSAETLSFCAQESVTGGRPVLLNAGHHIKAKCEGWNRYYKGHVTSANPDGSYDVEFEDGERKSGVVASQFKGGGTAPKGAGAGPPWSPVHSMPSARRGYAAGYLSGEGHVLVAGGNVEETGITCVDSAILYDPETDSWQPTAPMGTARLGAAAVALPGNQVMVLGGEDVDGHGLKSVEVYDGASRSWSAAPPMLSERKDMAAAVLSDGRVVVAGGYRAAAAAKPAGDAGNTEPPPAQVEGQDNLLATADMYLPDQHRYADASAPR